MKYYLLYLGIINLFSLFCYGIDKWLAIHKKNRISEMWLFLLSVIGGPLGSIIGMYFFRHKTKKIKFYFVNYTMLILWIYISIMFWMNGGY